ncbi:MAG: hypothetical protein DSM106950_02950 [Stigonema ocellatum SAG 48.90 = DSM 106950]|nr:hypothetical protein [Stigonema ocellatum SAG 48.90 = DSM 106950]
MGNGEWGVGSGGSGGVGGEGGNGGRENYCSITPFHPYTPTPLHPHTPTPPLQ